MKPILPDFAAEEGQCLPAAIALIFNNQNVLHKHKPKQYGYLVSQMWQMLPYGIGFDIIYCDKVNEDPIPYIKNEIEQADLTESMYVPFICQIQNHVVLYLIDKDKNVFGFDLLRKRAAQIPFERLEKTKINTVAVLCDLVTNSVYGLHRNDLKHLLV